MSAAAGRQPCDDPAKRILLLTPTGRDAILIGDALATIGIDTYPCAGAEMLCDELNRGAAAAVVTEEALTADSVKTLACAIRQQPPWSDFPLIVMTNGGAATPIVDLKLNALSPLGNVMLIERPLRPATLISMIRMVTRARERQYQVRELVADLRITEERLRTMIESAEDYAIISLDNDGRITFWNTGAERVLGYTEEEVMGRPLDIIFTEGDRLAGIPAAERRTAASTGRSESEGWRVRKDGSTFWGSGVVTPIRNGHSGDERTGFLKVLRNITEQREAAERLATQARQLERSNEDLQRFAYVASHDLQEPLRMVGSYSQLLVHRNREKLDEDSRVFVDYILSGVKQMHALIRDLLEFSRLSNDEAPPAQPVDCNIVLGHALQNLQGKITDRGATVTFDQLPSVMANEIRVLQVFQNLIGNALKYSTEKPAIHIAAKRDNRFWILSVRDNGIGIAPEHHERIFGLFRRLHTRDEYSGTGIGLTTCKRIVEQLGGQIWVRSQPGQGSTFFFSLPAA